MTHSNDVVSDHDGVDVRAVVLFLNEVLEVAHSVRIATIISWKTDAIIYSFLNLMK